MSKQTQELTKLDPRITTFQEQLRIRYAEENKTAKKGQTVLVGSSLMEIFPIEKWQQEQNLGLPQHIYNRGIRATTTADVLAHMNTLIFDLQPSKLFINIGSNDVGFGVPEADFLANYAAILQQIKTKLPTTQVYAPAYYPVNTVAKFAGESEHEHSALFNTRSNASMAAASAKVATLVQQFGYQFINVNTGLTDAAGNLRAELTFDGVHMLPAGYQIVLQNLRPYL